MRVSRTVTYAIQALVQLAENPTTAPVPCRHLATEGRMPERFLLQILRDMVTSGILVSLRGVEGGYRLAKPAERITIDQVFEAVECPLVASVPPLDHLPDSARVKLTQAFDRISEYSRSELEGISLADLVSDARGRQARASAV